VVFAVLASLLNAAILSKVLPIQKAKGLRDEIKGKDGQEVESNLR
jgi:hypothetical protein